MLYVLYLSKGNNQNFLILVVFFTLTCICLYRIFLGPRGPLVLPSVGSFVPSVPQEKFGSLIYRHICLMNHEDTHQTNPMAPWDPL